MGSNENKGTFEYPAKYMYVRNFYIGKYEITNKQFEYFLQNNPQWKKSNIKKLIEKKLVSVDYLDNWKKGKMPEKLKNHPVVYISWFAAVAYCSWLSELTGDKYRLPSELEWEYAAGNGERHDPFGIMPMTENDLTFAKNPGPFKTTRPVGSHKPNLLGLYDMNGNVWEFTMSTFAPYPYVARRVESMKSLKPLRRIAIRGGSYDTFFVYTGTTFRKFAYAATSSDEIGFRVVKVADK
jgi:formylglycine-generating enzyme required for sulfatase activity